jgi:hypothetical protein
MTDPNAGKPAEKPAEKKAAKAEAKERKVNLTQTVLFQKKFYGPGKNIVVPTDFPDVKDLAARRKASEEAAGVVPLMTSNRGDGGAPDDDEDVDAEDADA